MSTALVLGGGGPLGIAWQAGLLTGLARRGAPVARADLVVGTSAGAVVGAALTADLDLAELPGRVAGPLPLAPGSSSDVATLMALTAGPDNPGNTLERVTGYALSADTISEADYLSHPLFTTFSGLAWPAAFRCTALDVSAQRLRLWDASSGTGLSSALAASCAVPGLFPPVTIGGARYLDGGVLSPLNAALAAGYPHVVVMSCFALTAAGAAPATLAAAQRQLAEIRQLRSGGSDVTVIEPGQAFLVISEWGMGVMNTEHVADAYQAGLDQGGETALRHLPQAGQD